MTDSDHASGPLPEEFAWLLQRTDGFLDLGMPARARAEFDRIPAAWRGDPDAQRIGLRLASASQDWPECLRLARALRECHPDEVSWWVMLAYAMRRIEGLPAAEAVLRDARSRFPEVAVIPFNLACYACQMGRTDEAMTLLAEAVRLDAGFHEAAREDEDLRPLWPRLNA